MKSSQLKYVLILMIAPIFISCKKWVFVEPKTEIREESFFNSELGFQEALNGVYATMGSPKMYGKNMTWGLTDVMGGLYYDFSLELQYQKAAVGDLNDVLIEQESTDIWATSYFAIANLNNLLSNLQKADAGLFKGNTRALMEGEALGLRAMIHFDLLRLFGPAHGSAEWNKKLMPYVTQYDRAINPRITPDEVVRNILDDLRKAEVLLASDEITSASYKPNRKVRFNYFAVKALQARVNLWTNKIDEARAAAESVIAVSGVQFPWTDIGSILGDGNMIYASELIFSLYVNNLRAQIDGKLDNINFLGGLNARFEEHFGIDLGMQQDIFEAAGPGVTDYRNIFGLKEFSGSSFFGGVVTTYTYMKLHQNGATSIFGGTWFPDSVARRLPLIRISEMHYIAAECKAETDPAGAVAHLNLVREWRGIFDPLSAQLSPDAIRQEVFKEYRKEFTNDGQVYFYKKRRGMVNYSLSVPQREIELGN